MAVVLQDMTKFREENKLENPCILENKITKALKILRDANIINEAKFKHLKPIGSQTPSLYGLPKIHKPTVPLRPIHSMCNSPQHKLAKWLAEILKPVQHQLAKYSLKDSFEFVHAISELNISSLRMSSLDIQSLFTNVPLDETIKFVCEYISTNDIPLPIPVSELDNLLRLCTSNVQFQFRGKYYRQIDGVAMGSPLGPILADIFVAKIERESEEVDQTMFYRRYVDDIFMLTRDECQTRNVLNSLNSLHPSMRFTLEEECDSSLAFLDVKLRRRFDGTLQRAVFRKSTWTGQYLRFDSFVPIQYKRSLVKTLFNRARRICTDDTLNQELEHLNSVLQTNGYPSWFIRRFSKQRTSQETIIGPSKKPVFLHLPFKGDDIHKCFMTRLFTAVARAFPVAKPVIIYSTTRVPTTSIKDRLPVPLTSHCLYKFECQCSSTYIGVTQRQLQSRMIEHLPKWVCAAVAEQRHTPAVGGAQGHGHKTPASSIARHLLATGHKVSAERNFTVFFRHHNKRTLQFAEAVAIHRLKPILCVQKDLFVKMALPW